MNCGVMITLGSPPPPPPPPLPFPCTQLDTFPTFFLHNLSSGHNVSSIAPAEQSSSASPHHPVPKPKKKKTNPILVSFVQHVVGSQRSAGDSKDRII